MQAGYAGKLPAYGDFVEGGGSIGARQKWSAWAERGLVAARDASDGTFNDVFLTSPIWRFAVADGVFGSTPVAGVFCPSMDKVGRLFPFSVVADLAEGVAPQAAVAALGPWFDQLETAVLAALDPSATVEALADSITDPAPLRANGAARPLSSDTSFGPLSVTAHGEPMPDQGDALDLSDAEPAHSDGVWITLGGVDADARGVSHIGAVSDALFAALVMGGNVNAN